jgi:hypothetical protein
MLIAMYVPCIQEQPHEHRGKRIEKGECACPLERRVAVGDAVANNVTTSDKCMNAALRKAAMLLHTTKARVTAALFLLWLSQGGQTENVKRSKCAHTRSGYNRTIKNVQQMPLRLDK